MVKVNVKMLKDAVNQSLSSKSFIGMLLKASDGVLNVDSMDNDSYMSISVPIDEKDVNLMAVVDKKALLNILKAIKSDYVFLSMTEENLKDYLVISNNRMTYRLQSQDPALFRTYDLDKDINNGVVLNSKDVINAIDRVIYAVSKDKYDHEAYKCIGFIFENNSFFVAGTDGYRLAVCDLKIPNNLSDRIGIPKSAALHLKKILKKDVLFNIVDDGVSKIAVFKTGNFKFTTRLADGVYPNILEIVNNWRKHLTIELKLSREVMIDILQPFIIEKKDKYPIRLTLKNNLLNILSLDDNGEVNGVVNYTGDEYSISFNALYLLEAFDNICSDDVILRLPSDHDHAAYIEPVDGCDCLAMVMPTKV